MSASKDERLQEGLSDLLVETPDGWIIRDSPPRSLGMISWDPGLGGRH